MNMKENQKNFLEVKPCRFESLTWKADYNGMVTLEIENKGFFNRMAQKFFKKPQISYVHLDEMGSFLWPLMNGDSSILDLGKRVEVKFGEKAYPLYERLAQYIQILNSYRFVYWK